jgi:hypothetical protein
MSGFFRRTPLSKPNPNVLAAQGPSRASSLFSRDDFVYEKNKNQERIKEINEEYKFLTGYHKKLVDRLKASGDKYRELKEELNKILDLFDGISSPSGPSLGYPVTVSDPAYGPAYGPASGPSYGPASGPGPVPVSVRRHAYPPPPFNIRSSAPLVRTVSGNRFYDASSLQRVQRVQGGSKTKTSKGSKKRKHK